MVLYLAERDWKLQIFTPHVRTTDVILDACFELSGPMDSRD